MGEGGMVAWLHGGMVARVQGAGVGVEMFWVVWRGLW